MTSPFQVPGSNAPVISPPTKPPVAPYDPMAKVREFHKVFGVRSFVEESDPYGRSHNLTVRLKLIDEEYREVADELLDGINGNGDTLKLAKELADLLYVVYGTAAVLDIPLDKVFDEVHRSNMSKLGADGKPIYRHDGKILKGPRYQEPDMVKIFGVSD